MSNDKEKMLELIKQVVEDYFESEDNTDAAAIDAIFTIDEILNDQDIIAHAPLYGPPAVVTEKNQIGFDVVD